MSPGTEARPPRIGRAIQSDRSRVRGCPIRHGNSAAPAGLGPLDAQTCGDKPAQPSDAATMRTPEAIPATTLRVDVQRGVVIIVERTEVVAVPRCRAGAPPRMLLGQASRSSWCFASGRRAATLRELRRALVHNGVVVGCMA